MNGHTYNNGQPYLPARGRNAKRVPLEDYSNACHPIINGRPTTEEFLQSAQREMKIRAYRPKTIKMYIGCLRTFLGWYGRKPHAVDRESVKCFLETLVDGGAHHRLWLAISQQSEPYLTKCAGEMSLWDSPLPDERKKSRSFPAARRWYDCWKPHPRSGINC